MEIWTFYYHKTVKYREETRALDIVCRETDSVLVDWSSVWQVPKEVEEEDKKYN